MRREIGRRAAQLTHDGLFGSVVPSSFVRSYLSLQGEFRRWKFRVSREQGILFSDLVSTEAPAVLLLFYGGDVFIPLVRKRTFPLFYATHTPRSGTLRARAWKFLNDHHSQKTGGCSGIIPRNRTDLARYPSTARSPRPLPRHLSTGRSRGGKGIRRAPPRLLAFPPRGRPFLPSLPCSLVFDPSSSCRPRRPRRPRRRCFSSLAPRCRCPSRPCPPRGPPGRLLVLLLRCPPSTVLIYFFVTSPAPCSRCRGSFRRRHRRRHRNLWPLLRGRGGGGSLPGRQGGRPPSGLPPGTLAVVVGGVPGRACYRMSPAICTRRQQDSKRRQRQQRTTPSRVICY